MSAQCRCNGPWGPPASGQQQRLTKQNPHSASCKRLLQQLTGGPGSRCVLGNMKPDGWHISEVWAKSIPPNESIKQFYGNLSSGFLFLSAAWFCAAREGEKKRHCADKLEENSAWIHVLEKKTKHPSFANIMINEWFVNGCDCRDLKLDPPLANFPPVRVNGAEASIAWPSRDAQHGDSFCGWCGAWWDNVRSSHIETRFADRNRLQIRNADNHAWSNAGSGCEIPQKRAGLIRHRHFRCPRHRFFRAGEPPQRLQDVRLHHDYSESPLEGRGCPGRIQKRVWRVHPDRFWHRCECTRDGRGPVRREGRELWVAHSRVYHSRDWSWCWRRCQWIARSRSPAPWRGAHDCPGVGRRRLYGELRFRAPLLRGRDGEFPGNRWESPRWKTSTGVSRRWPRGMEYRGVLPGGLMPECHLSGLPASHCSGGRGDEAESPVWADPEVVQAASKRLSWCREVQEWCRVGWLYQGEHIW